MPSNYDNNLLREGMLNIKAKNYAAARRYFERALELADDVETRVQANYHLSRLTEDPVQKREYLEETIAISPSHAEARKALAILDGKLKPGEIVDADALPSQPTETQNAKADRFTCPKCGSRMVFDGDGRSLVCEACSRQQVLSVDAPANEQDFVLAMATGQSQRKPVAMKTFQCRGCGANFLVPPQAISQTCCYCGAVYVLAGTRELVGPDSIVPMAFDQHEAALRLIKWVEKHKIIPQEKVQAPRGLYMPLWTFDIMGELPWSGRLQRNKQVVAVHGVETVHFDDIVVYSTSKLADLLPNIIKDFSLGSAPAYDARYLAGWPAEIYETTMAEASLDARKQAVKSVRDSIYSQEAALRDLRYSTANLSILSFKLVLVPVWVTEYVLDGRTYRVIINGQTGSVYGETASQGILGWLESVFDG